MANKSHLTATRRRRRALSAPMRWLKGQGLLLPPPPYRDHSFFRLLDYGCGHGGDVKILTRKSYCDINMYDPYYFQRTLYSRYYDVVTCHYVLNVIRLKKEREAVVEDIRRILKPNGVGYVTVRRDFKGWYISKNGAWIGNVQVPTGRSTHRTDKFEIYEIRPC